MSKVRLGAFETIREVGAGGMGTVWLGRHVVTDASVAIKFLTSERAREPAWVAAFQAEARAIARLSHPRIVRIHDIGMVPERSTLAELPGGSPYIVMEWISSSLVDVPRPLAWETTRAILLEVLDGLAHVHARGVVHLDIKPSNVLGKVGRLRVADFGISQTECASPDETLSGVSGTPYFMAPEQFTPSAGRVGSWTDLYAVGCLGHLLATGRSPFEGNSAVELGAHHLHTPFPVDGFSGDLARWFSRMTAKNPAARYRFAAEAARELATIEEAFSDPSVSPTEHWISPGNQAPETVPLTTILLFGPSELSTTPIWREAAKSSQVPSRVPDWRKTDEVRSHIEHVQGAGLAVSTIRLPPFAGREDERDALWETFRTNVLGARPSATVLIGPPGSGKSRLALWLATRAHELGLAPRIGPVSCRSTDEPFVRMALDELGVERDDLNLLGERVDQRLAGSGVSATERNSIVYFLTGRLDASAPRERLAAMRAALGVCAGGRPLLVVIDDIDEAPGEVLEAVYHTIRAKECVHFVMTSAREIPDPREKFATIALTPLADGYMSRIVRDLAGLHQDLAADVVAIARGNPGYAIRLVRGLVERGHLRAGAHGFELLSNVDLHLPEASELWTDRLEQLFREIGHTARGSLEVAAVLGDEVRDEQWRAVCETSRVHIPPRLVAELEQRDFVTQTSRGWMFADIEFKDRVVLAAKDRNTWKTYVAAARETLPNADPARLAGWDLDLGRPALAARGFIEAARSAERVCLFSRAARMLNRAEEAAAKLDPSDAQRFLTEVDVARSSVWGLERLDDADELARGAAETALANGWTDLLGQALERRAKFARKRVDLPLAEQLYQEAREAFEQAGDVEGTGLALQGLGMVAVARGRLHEAEGIYDEALQTLLSIRSLRGAAWCANGLGDVYRKLGSHDLANSWYERALNWFEQVGNSYGAMWCVHDLALTKRARGDLEGAAEGLAETLRMAGRLGQRMVAPRLNLGIVRVLSGEEKLARVSFEEVLEESLLRGISGEEAMARICLLPCDAAAGQFSMLTENLESALGKLGGLVDADLGLMAQIAAKHAASQGENDLAGTLYAFAETQGVS